ncbi:MAG: ion channel [Rikenellaceae bacterium]
MSFVLIVALSIEVIYTEHNKFSQWFVNLQLAICILFIIDFFVTMAAAKDRMGYFWSHLAILIISLPYLCMTNIHQLSFDVEGVVLIALMPILRAFVAIYIMLRWLIRGALALRLLYAYVLSVVSFTYISALLFYECELNTNPDLVNFADALWWASMGLTTTELTIYPITATGKILAVALPLAGMLMLPVATNFLFSIRKGGKD